MRCSQLDRVFQRSVVGKSTDKLIALLSTIYATSMYGLQLHVQSNITNSKYRDDNDSVLFLGACYMNKRTIQRIATMGLVASLVGYFVYQGAYGTTKVDTNTDTNGEV